MPQLIVRNLDSRVVAALKARAASRGRSAEAEHRAILERALLAAATARIYKLTVVTSNVGDFSGLPVKVLNPFSLS